MSKPLPRSGPEPMGVDPKAVMAFIDAVEAAKLELHGFMMLRGGHVVAEGWWKPYGPEKPHMLFSLSKSFTSTAVGFAVAEGRLSVDDPVLKFFADEAPERPGRYWKDMTVKHLLSMNTGHDVDTTGFLMSRRDGDWVRAFLRRPLKHKPGTHFLYNTGATYMLSVIVQKLTGQRVLDYLTPRLFQPLGIEGATWEQCPKGYDTGGFGLSIKTEDIARFGQFLLQKGMCEGKQLLPAAWVDEASSVHSDNSKYGATPDWKVGYGYQFWRCVPDCYRGDGAFGQYCVVIPRLDTVFAINSGLGDMQAVLDHLWKVLPGISDSRQDDPAGRAAMAERLANLSYAPPKFDGSAAVEAAVSGKTYALEANPERMKTVKFSFTAGACAMETRFGRGRVPDGTFGAYSSGFTSTMTFGRGAWAEGASETANGTTNVAASFTWDADGTLVLTERDVNTPFVVTRRVRFSGGEVEIQSSLNVSFGPNELPVVRGEMK